jgi:hypothetical protein
MPLSVGDKLGAAEIRPAAARRQKGHLVSELQASGETRITRRSALRGALMAAAVTAASPALAQQMQTHLPPGVAAKPKGPIVFLDYDKEEIDFAYDQAP